MAGGISGEVLELVRNMAVDIAVIKEVTKPLPEMYKDIYIGNGDPPIRDTCREYVAEVKKRETAKTEAIKSKADDRKKFYWLIIGGAVGMFFSGAGGILFAYVKLLPLLSAINGG